MFCEKILLVDDLNFVPNCLLMLHPTRSRAVTLLREDFKAEAGVICGSIQTNLKMLKAGRWMKLDMSLLSSNPLERPTQISTDFKKTTALG